MQRTTCSTSNPPRILYLDQWVPRAARCCTDSYLTGSKLWPGCSLMGCGGFSLSRLAVSMQALEGRGEARTWLIPLLRQHVSGAHLNFWSQTLLPLASSMGSRAAAAGQDPQRR